MSEQALETLRGINGEQLVLLIILIIGVIYFVASHLDNVKNFWDSIYNYRKHKEELYNTILQNSEDIKKLKENDINETQCLKELQTDMSLKIEKIFEKLECLENKRIEDNEWRDKRAAIDDRTRILTFADEIHMQVEHSKERYDDILRCIDEYESYCKAHPEFMNGKAVMSIEAIRTAYREKFLK